jgi:phage terminase large subunit GpA-like protein
VTHSPAHQSERERHRTLERRLAELFDLAPIVQAHTWGHENRTYPPTSGVPGKRDPALTPYIIPFERFFDLPCEEVPESRYETCVLITGTQMSKTDAILDAIGSRLDTRPRPQLYVGPSKDFVTDQFEPRLMTLFDEAPRLAARVARGKRNKKVKKYVNGVGVRLAWAGSPTSLSSDQAGDIYVDEYDKMFASGRGNPFVKAKARADTYDDRKIALTSTPSKGLVGIEKDAKSGLEFWQLVDPKDLQSPIWVRWQTGTRHHFAWCCPHCDGWFIPRYRNLAHPKDASPAEARRNTWLVCPRCEKKIDERHKTAMNTRGDIVAPGQKFDRSGKVVGDPIDSTVLSLWVSGLCSPFVTWGERVEEVMLAKASGDSEAEADAFNKVGELYSPLGLNVAEWKTVADHRAPYRVGEVPDDAVYLALTVDVQKNRLPWVIRGHGARATSWLIDSGNLLGETVEELVWDELADLLQDPINGIPIRLCLIDSGFRPGKPITLPLNRIYEFCRRFPRQVRPTKGSSNPMRVPLVTSKIEVTTAGTKSKYGLELLRLDPDHFKSWVHERLEWPSDKPGAWHLYEGVSEDYCKQIVSEVRVVAPSGKAAWVQRSRENHFLDCEALQAAASWVMNMQRMTEDAAQRLIRQRDALRVSKEELPAPAAMKAKGVRRLSQLNKRT